MYIQVYLYVNVISSCTSCYLRILGKFNCSVVGSNCSWLQQQCSKCTNYSAIGEALLILLSSSYACDTSLYMFFNFAKYLQPYESVSHFSIFMNINTRKVRQAIFWVMVNQLTTSFLNTWKIRIKSPCKIGQKWKVTNTAKKL